MKTSRQTGMALLTAGALLSLQHPVLAGDEQLNGEPPSSAQLRAFRPHAPWHEGHTRLFVGTRTDLGFLFFRPRLSAGYGIPHRTWVGGDLNPILSGTAAGGYLGARFAFRYINLRVGGRYGYAFARSFLEPMDSYDALQLESRDGPQASYLSWESELTYSIPVPGGSIVGESAATLVTLVPSGKYVFEDTLNVVVAPPLVVRQRLGYSFRFGLDRAFKLTLLGEVVFIPRRQMQVYRAGITASVKISDSLSFRTIAIPVLASPDSLGADGSDAFLVGVRHYWATGP